MNAKTIHGDYSAANLAAIFGRRTLDRLAQGLDVSLSARLAATFAARVLEEDNGMPWNKGATHWCSRCLMRVLPVLKEQGALGEMQITCPNCGAYGNRLQLLEEQPTDCDHCDGYRIPSHVCPGGALLVSGLIAHATPASSVRVELPIGESTFARATADVFTSGELTVTSIDTGAEMRVFPFGTWSHATVYDASGNVLFGFNGSLATRSPRKLEAAS